jgi:hypothetical protein
MDNLELSKPGFSLQHIPRFGVVVTELGLNIQVVIY